MKSAIFPLSADPIHYGHMAVVKEASDIFDRVYIALGLNPKKKGRHLFTEDERLELAKNAVKTLGLEDKVEVESFSGLLASYAIRKGSEYIVRGVRDAKDLEYEVAAANFHSTYDLETILLPTTGSQSSTSSTMLKDVVSNGGLVHNYTTPKVKQALEEKLLGVSLIGVTGLMGAGKSTFCRKLCEYEGSGRLTHIDCDAVAHSLYQEGSTSYPEVHKAIKEAFGEEVCKGSSINRKALAEKALKNDEHRLQLMKILEKPFRAEIENIIGSSKGIVLLDAAYLDMMLPWVNYNVIMVKCSEEERKRRAFSRDHITEEKFYKVSSYQPPPDKLKGMLEELHERHKHGLLYEFDSEKIDYKEALEWIMKNFPMTCVGIGQTE
ncbi:MAG: pantetheine-phosphate adenylyltransferase [Candidatus Woesearchaeota archaeon]